MNESQEQVKNESENNKIIDNMDINQHKNHDFS